jgi:hypothetical protein
MNPLILLFWSLFIFATHELAHIIIAKHYGHYKGLQIYWYGIAVNIKYPIDVQTWFKIISAGIIATTPLVVLLFAYYYESFYAMMALLISTYDLIILYAIHKTRRINPFFNYITNKTRIQFNCKVFEES